MRKLLLSVAIVTMMLNAPFAAAQTEPHQNHSEGVHHADEHAGPQHGETPEKLPGAKPKADTAGPHGGRVQEVGQLRVETIVETGGLRLFIYNPNGKALDLSGARGLVTLQIDGVAKRYRYDLFPEVGDDKQAESMAVAVDLSRIAGRNVELAIQLAGIQGTDRRPLQFSATASVPMTEAQKVAAAIETQQVCPVSGQPLGSMGKAVPVAVGEHTVYVCCEGCIAQVKAEPQKYLAMVRGSTGAVPHGSEEVRPGVYKVTAADQPFIAAQQKCPVMDEPLDGMGGPYKVHANGKAVYICCPGCAKKIIAEPRKYLDMLTAAGVSPPELQTATDSSIAPAAGEEVRPRVFKVTAADQPFVEAQKFCPVMDEPLDGMGGPYRVNVEGRAVYICCPGCAKKLRANPDTYLGKLAEQGVTPPVVQ